MGENLSGIQSKFPIYKFLVWNRLIKCGLQVQGKDPSVEVTQDIIEESEDERFDDISDHIPPIELPPCEIIHLEEIKEVRTCDSI